MERVKLFLIFLCGSPEIRAIQEHKECLIYFDLFLLYWADFRRLFRDETTLLVNPRLYFFISPSIPTVLSIMAPRKVKECLDLLFFLIVKADDIGFFVTYLHAFCIIN